MLRIVTENLSQRLFEKAKHHLVGGVNSPVRAFKSVGGTPPFIVRAKGAHIFDADGKKYIDYVGSWGPAILGHAPYKVLQAINETMKSGTSFGAPTVKEIELAELVKKAFKSIELVRFVNSGTEATMSALRLIRGVTGRDKIIKFDGCYHGHADSLLVKAGSGAQTLGVPDSQGVPKDFAKHTLVANFNDLGSVEKLFDKNKDKIAGVIIEPIIGNMGCIPPQPQFLKELKKLAHANDALLIFDEVMTGFRVAFGGASQLYDVQPDLTCLGKIIGGGLPVGAYGGRQDLMEQVAPLGPVYQAGTLSGNPLAMAAGIATLSELESESVYDDLEQKGAYLENGIKQLGNNAGISLQVNRVGSMFSCFFTDKPVTNAETARGADSEMFKKVFHHLLESGINIAPSPFEAGFISVTHTQEDLDKTLEAFEAVF